MPTWRLRRDAEGQLHRRASRSLPPPTRQEQSICWDGKTPGLGLRVTANGAKSYIFESRLHGRTVRLTIGDIRTYKIGDAEKEATRLKRLTDQGTDPRQQKIEERAKAEAAITEAKLKTALVRDAWTAYLAHHKKRWGPRHFADDVNLSQAGGKQKKRGKGLTTQGVLYPLMDRRLTDISGRADQMAGQGSRGPPQQRTPRF